MNRRCGYVAAIVGLALVGGCASSTGGPAASAPTSPPAVSSSPVASPSSAGDNFAACKAARSDTNRFSPALDKAKTTAARKAVITQWVAALRKDAALGGPETRSGLEDIAMVTARWPTSKGTPGMVKLSAYANGLNEVCADWVK